MNRIIACDVSRKTNRHHRRIRTRRLVVGRWPRIRSVLVVEIRSAV
jgi:hypothetical protein